MLAVGALIGLVPSLLVERRKERRELATRWDAPLYELGVEFRLRRARRLAGDQHPFRVGLPAR